MLINSEFEINIRSIEEFACKSNGTEALDKTNLSIRETSDVIEIDMEIDGKRNFLYANQEDKIDEQKQTMVKILLLKV